MSVLQSESNFMGRVGFVLLKLYVILLHDILEASLQKVIRVLRNLFPELFSHP